MFPSPAALNPALSWSLIRVQIDLVHLPLNLTIYFPWRLTVLCVATMLLCVAALPVAIVFQKHLPPDIRDEWGRGECGEGELRLRHFNSSFMRCKHAYHGTGFLSPNFLPLLLLFCVNDFHEKALNKISHLRNTSVRWCQRLAYSSSCWVANMAFSHGPGMLDMVEWRKPNTGRVKLKNRWGLSVLSWAWRNGKNLQVIYCLCCSVNSDKGDGGDKKWDSKRPSGQLQGLQSRHSKCLSGWRTFAWRDSRNSDLTPHPQHFWNWMKVPYLNM